MTVLPHPPAIRSQTDETTSVRILSVPARHPYVEAIMPADAHAVAPDRVRGWDPDPALRPDRVTRWLPETDAVHLHFGFDHWDEPTARAWCEQLAAARVRLIVSVHDLRNPHHVGRAAHDAVLAVLAEYADAIVTLTSAAAREFAARFGREIEVIEHPRIVDPGRTSDVATVARTVGVALKSLRGNVIEPIEIVRAAASGAEMAGGRLRIDLHPEMVGDPRLSGLAELSEHPAVDLQIHPRYDDLELERYVRSLHATVLPYRFGTHSGWLELARDLGTRVVAPSCGHYADQWDQVITYRNDETYGFDPTSLSLAVASALNAPPPEPADRSSRERQAAAIRTAHAELYVPASRTPARDGAGAGAGAAAGERLCR